MKLTLQSSVSNLYQQVHAPQNQGDSKLLFACLALLPPSGPCKPEKTYRSSSVPIKSKRNNM